MNFSSHKNRNSSNCQKQRFGGLTDRLGTQVDCRAVCPHTHRGDSSPYTLFQGDPAWRPRAAALLHARAAGASMSAPQVCASRGACAPLHLPHALFCVLLNTHRSLPATHRGPPGKSVKVPVAKIAGQLVSMPGVGVVDISVSVRRKGAAERVRAWCCALTHMPPRPRRVRCNQSCRPPAAASPRPDARLAQCSPPLRLR